MTYLPVQVAHSRMFVRVLIGRIQMVQKERILKEEMPQSSQVLIIEAVLSPFKTQSKVKVVGDARSWSVNASV